ncbi:MAG: CHASE2 domain-containing protein [Opitutaceae bacterium]
MPKLTRARFDWRYLFLLPIPLLWALLGHYGFLDRLENQFLDLRFRIRGEIEAPVNLIYVDVDTRAVQALGERPWSREAFGVAARALIENGGARAVGFDFVFSALGRASALVDEARVAEGRLAFHRVIRKHPNIILAVQYTEGQAVTQGAESMRKLPLLRMGKTDRSKNDVPEMPEWPLVGPTWGRVGLIDFDIEYGSDGVPRWVPMFAHTMNPTLYHLSLQLVLQSLRLDETAVRIFDDRIDLVGADERVELTIPLREKQLVEVNWFSRWGSKLNPRVSLADVLGHERLLFSSKPEERAAAEEYFNWFRGAIVLVGPTDTLLQDLAPTGMERAPVPKVGVHGNMVKTILTGKFLQHTPKWANWAGVFALTLGVSWLAMTGGSRAIWFKLTAVALLLTYFGLCVVMFNEGHIVFPMAVPLGGALSTSFVGVIWQLLLEEKQKSRIKGMFGTYVSPQLVERMVASGKSPQLGGHEQEITAYFSDIQGFSAFSEILPPAQLVELMNEYLTACTDLVQNQGGALDKYIGDAVVAMFGAPITLPDHAYRACVASQLVHLKLGELREKWKGEGTKWPEVVWNMQSRIGLNSGFVTIGNMGSRTRFNYTMMGDNVNLAARMESGAKTWGVYTMVTETTKLQCEQHGGDRAVFRPLARLQVMGRAQAVPIFEIAGLKEFLPQAARDCIGVFEQGLAKFYARDWSEAVRLFTQSAELEPNQPGKTSGVKTNPSLVYIARARHYQVDPPPEDWDGRYVMTEK